MAATLWSAHQQQQPVALGIEQPHLRAKGLLARILQPLRAQGQRLLLPLRKVRAIPLPFQANREPATTRRHRPLTTGAIQLKPTQLRQRYAPMRCAQARLSGGAHQSGIKSR